MKECEKVSGQRLENRKAWLEKQNDLIKSKTKTPEPSLLGSSLFSYDISLNSLSLKTESENTLRNFSSRSKKPSEIFYECVDGNVSEKDRKILRLMAARREAKMEEDEMAFSAKNVWEEEKLRHEKKMEEKKKALKEYLAKKKRMEELENFVKKNERNERLKQEKMVLELKIKEKQERFERRQNEILSQKKWKRESLRTDAQIALHRQIKAQKELEEKEEKALHAKLFEAKERRSEENLKCLLMEKYIRLKEESLKREVKCEAARSLREEHNKKEEERRREIEKLNERRNVVRQQKLHCSVELKKRILLDRNETKKQEHSLIYNKLKEEEREKMNRTRKKIEAKYFKMKILEEKRKSAIFRSRFNARTSASLRQKIRMSYNL